MIQNMQPNVINDKVVDAIYRSIVGTKYYCERIDFGEFYLSFDYDDREEYFNGDGSERQWYESCDYIYHDIEISFGGAFKNNEDEDAITIDIDMDTIVERLAGMLNAECESYESYNVWYKRQH